MSVNLFSVNDPIHGLMQFTRDQSELIRDIISTPEFQRLRFIKQLGMDFYVYPGATHNRFSHSLGVAYLSKRIIEKLMRDSNNNKAKKAFLSELLNSVIVMGLLHDIGHGPYSHMFERIKYEENSKIDHEKITLIIIDEMSKNKKLRDHREILQEAFQTFKNIQDYKDKKINKLAIKDQFIKSLLSSQLDADRMDYLLRDSHFCGVDYGNYDLKWLIHGIQYCHKKNIVGVNRKAIGVVEHYLMARRLMTNCVYKHAKVVASEYFLSELLADAYENLEIFADNNTYKNLLLIKYFKCKRDKKENDFLESYLKITDIDVEIFVKILASQNKYKNKIFKIISDRIFMRRFPTIIEIDYSRKDDARIIIDDFKKNSDIKEWQINLDSREIKTYKDNSDTIYVIDDNENIKSIDSVSLPVFSMTNKDEVNPILIIDNEVIKRTSKLKNNLEVNGCLAVAGKAI